MKRRSLALLDVTAMSGDAVCVAGLDRDTGETIRLNDPQPTQRHVRDFRGLAPGDTISAECDRVHSVAPHVEDARWQPRSLKKAGTLTHEELLSLAEPHVLPSVVAAFGSRAKKAHGGNHSWPAGSGERSLAFVQVRYVRFDLDAQSRVRAAIKDGHEGYWGAIPFQDYIARTHQATCEACAADYLSAVRGEFAANRSIVRLGLTRPFAPEEGGESVGCRSQTSSPARARISSDVAFAPRARMIVPSPARGERTGRRPTGEAYHLRLSAPPRVCVEFETLRVSAANAIASPRV